jgi:hypothetical protein
LSNRHLRIHPIRDSTDVETTKEFVADDPGVKAGVFVYDVHPGLSFPGDALPS